MNDSNFSSGDKPGDGDRRAASAAWWREKNREILSRIDVISEYRSMGVRFVKDSAPASGWAPCYAFGREDKHPSAGVNLRTGHYKDHGNGLSLGFFEFCTRYGGFSSWHAARDHYAAQVGVDLPACAPGDKVSDLKGSQPSLPASSPTPPKTKRTTSYWEEILREGQEAMDGFCVKERLAYELGLPFAFFDALPVGYCARDYHGPCYLFSERDHAGNVIGLLRRYQGGSKKAYPDGQRGLTLPSRGWDQGGDLYVPEGASDVLALVTLGLPTVGRPEAGGGADLLAALIATLPIDRRVVILGENDPKPDGRWPGREGAEGTARRVAALTGRTIYVAYPPDGAKDVRAWLTEREPDLPSIATPGLLGDYAQRFTAHVSATARAVLPLPDAGTTPDSADHSLDTVCARARDLGVLVVGGDDDIATLRGLGLPALTVRDTWDRETQHWDDAWDGLATFLARARHDGRLPHEVKIILLPGWWAGRKGLPERIAERVSDEIGLPLYLAWPHDTYSVPSWLSAAHPTLTSDPGKLLVLELLREAKVIGERRDEPTPVPKPPPREYTDAEIAEMVADGLWMLAQPDESSPATPPVDKGSGRVSYSVGSILPHRITHTLSLCPGTAAEVHLPQWFDAGRPCPRTHLRHLIHRYHDGEEAAIHPRCRRWDCPACAPWSKQRWAERLYLALLGLHGEVYLYLGKADEWTALRGRIDRVGKATGTKPDYVGVRHSEADGCKLTELLVISTVPFTGSSACSGEHAFRAILKALTAIPAVKGRCKSRADDPDAEPCARPVLVSRGWLPPSEKGPSQWKRGSIIPSTPKQLTERLLDESRRDDRFDFALWDVTRGASYDYGVSWTFDARLPEEERGKIRDRLFGDVLPFEDGVHDKSTPKSPETPPAAVPTLFDGVEPPVPVDPAPPAPQTPAPSATPQPRKGPPATPESTPAGPAAEQKEAPPAEAADGTAGGSDRPEVAGTIKPNRCPDCGQALQPDGICWSSKRGKGCGWRACGGRVPTAANGPEASFSTIASPATSCTRRTRPDHYTAYPRPS